MISTTHYPPFTHPGVKWAKSFAGVPAKCSSVGRRHLLPCRGSTVSKKLACTETARSLEARIRFTHSPRCQCPLSSFGVLGVEMPATAAYQITCLGDPQTQNEPRAMAVSDVKKLLSGGAQSVRLKHGSSQPTRTPMSTAAPGKYQGAWEIQSIRPASLALAGGNNFTVADQVFVIRLWLAPQRDYPRTHQPHCFTSDVHGTFSLRQHVGSRGTAIL